MITSLRGNVLQKTENYLIIEVNNIGYKVFVGATLLQSMKDECLLYTYHHIREDNQSLFGFTSMEELEFFEHLLTVQGVGPKVALNILDLAPIDKLQNAIVNEDEAFLFSVKGIGKKTAAKIIIELSTKITKLSSIAPSNTKTKVTQDFIEALQSLGYSMNDIRPLLAKIDTSKSLEALIKESLAQLKKG